MNSESKPLPDSKLHSRFLRSSGRKRGRKLGEGKTKLLAEVLPPLQVELSEVCELFSQAKSQEIFLEIGFGTGTHLAQQARLNPDALILGCEPYIHGVAELLQTMEREQLNNIRFYTDDVRLLLEKIPEASLDKIFILYPDPWPKPKHNKRRLISKEFLAELARVLKPGAQLRLASDDAGYVTWILERILTCSEFTWQAGQSADWTKAPADWVTTRYEQKAIKAGRVPSYLNFTRT